MAVFKEINSSDFSLVETTTHKNQTLTDTSTGVDAVRFVSGSSTTSLSSSYWNSLHFDFYLSGSSQILSSHPNDYTRFRDPYYVMVQYNPTNPVYLNKFYSSGSVISIPHKYIGEGIKKGSFTLNDTLHSETITIKDDSYGNLYSINASHSQSAATSISSSDNYVGNIFYDFGVVTLTETGSWSGSINYTDITSGSAYSLEFKSTNTIWSREYSVQIGYNDFNRTMNVTSRGFVSASTGPEGRLLTASPYLAAHLTSSGWSPYLTSIQLYGESLEPRKTSNIDSRTGYEIREPLIVANLPRPIQVRPDMTMTFKIRLDM